MAKMPLMKPNAVMPKHVNKTTAPQPVVKRGQPAAKGPGGKNPPPMKSGTTLPRVKSGKC